MLSFPGDRLTTMGEHRGPYIRWRDEIWPLAVLLLLAAWYFFSFYNRFAGLRSGDGEFGGGMAFLAGLRPYRDYFTAGPPLNQLKAAVELTLFGKSLIVSRTLGVLERLSIVVLLYCWLRRSFSTSAAMLASFITIIVSAGDRTDPIASYNHDAILFAMICGFAASLSLEAIKPRTALYLGALAGVGAGLSFLTKQTVGAAAMVSVLVFGSIAIGKLRGTGRAAAWSVAFLAGVASPVLAMGFYLWRAGVLHTCLTMLFVSGPAAKASRPFLFLSREIMIAGDNWVWLMLGLIAIMLSARAVWRASTSSTANVDLGTRRWVDGILWCSFVVVATAELLAHTSLPALVDFGKSSVYYVLFGCALLGVVALFIGLRDKEKSPSRILNIALFAALAWSVAAALSLSWPAFEAMTLPGLGLLLAATIDGTRGKWGQGFLYLVLAAMVFIQIREKLDMPFGFDHQDEAAVRFATARSSQPELRDMKLSPEMTRLLDDALLEIRTNAKPDDTIFTFPEMGIFYALSGRRAPTWTDSHNIDVVQDSFARAEAERLLRSRPAVIVYARPTDTNMRQDERVWREGRPSGQRAMIAALDSMLSDYRLVGTYQLLPDDNPIRLYVRLQSSVMGRSAKAALSEDSGGNFGHRHGEISP